MTIEKFILEILCLVGMTLGIRLYNKNDSIIYEKHETIEQFK